MNSEADTVKPRITPGAGLWGGNLIEFSEITSTNRWALNAANGCSHGDVVSAELQKDGYGRYGREWTARAGASITCSAVLGPEWVDGCCITLLPMTAALAVAAAVSPLDIDVRMKWPNDVMVCGRKLCGILAERIGDRGPVILGIGLNVNMDESDLAGISGMPATSLLLETGTSLTLDAVRGQILGRLQGHLDLLKAGGLTAIMGAWESRDALAGSEIVLAAPGGAVAGRYAGLDEEGRLRIRVREGDVQVFSSGEIASVRAAIHARVTEALQ
jgi:BirA family transcriptional regulator, biotin operon repressor / biotin---[acetyl-CoA-carboxylase] ligase